MLRDVAMATNFGTKILLTGFRGTIATRQLLMEGVSVVDSQNADIANARHPRVVAIEPFFGFLYMGCTLAPPGECDCTIHVQQRCGLLLNYFDHLLLLGHIAVLRT